MPLYLYEEERSEAARLLASRWSEGALVSPLAELEFTNTLCRKVLEKEITLSIAEQLRREFQNDLKAGIFCWPLLNLAVMFRDAVDLSLQYTPTGGHRSLDVLHVSAAKLCRADEFYSFDGRLNRLAKIEGLKVIAASK